MRPITPPAQKAHPAGVGRWVECEARLNAKGSLEEAREVR